MVLPIALFLKNNNNFQLENKSWKINTVYRRTACLLLRLNYRFFFFLTETRIALSMKSTSLNDICKPVQQFKSSLWVREGGWGSQSSQ